MNGEYWVDRKIIHEYYDRNTRSNDIGLIRLQELINFLNSHAKKILLPSSGYLPDELILAGLGAGYVSENRQWTVIIFQSNKLWYFTD